MYKYKLFEWTPSDLVNVDSKFICDQYAVIILNTPIHWKPEFLLPLWERATLRLTVDGGSNRWFEWLRQNDVDWKSVQIPQLVTGDMDSIDPNVLDLLKENGVCVKITPDQNETDFTKSLREIKSYINSNDLKIINVIVVVDSAGRLDQTMANINTLFKASDIIPECNVFNLANDSLSWLLRSGKHKIHVHDTLRNNKTWCSLIPIGNRAEHVTTTGMKWNLVDKTLNFGDLVSTSNTYTDKAYVTVETITPLLWCMGLKYS